MDLGNSTPEAFRISDGLKTGCMQAAAMRNTSSKDYWRTQGKLIELIHISPGRKYYYLGVLSCTVKTMAARVLSYDTPHLLLTSLYWLLKLNKQSKFVSITLY